MQIFTIQILLEMYLQAHHLTQMLFNTLLTAVCQNILIYPGDIWMALAQHDWSKLSINLMTFGGSVVFLYRIVRSKSLMALESMFDRWY